MKGMIATMVALTLLAASPSPGPRTDTGIPGEVPDHLFVIAKRSILRQLETCEQKSFRHLDCTDHDRGLFVRLMHHGRERGCIGFVRGVASFEEAAALAAVDAAFFDPRYPPLSTDELDDLVIEITLVGRLRAMARWDDFTPGRHSVYLVTAYGKAFMQAQVVTERGWGKNEFLEAICRKAGIDENSYMKKETRLYRAETVFRRVRLSEISTEK